MIDTPRAFPFSFVVGPAAGELSPGYQHSFCSPGQLALPFPLRQLSTLANHHVRALWPLHSFTGIKLLRTHCSVRGMCSYTFFDRFLLRFRFSSTNIYTVKDEFLTHAFRIPESPLLHTVSSPPAQKAPDTTHHLRTTHLAGRDGGKGGVAVFAQFTFPLQGFQTRF